MNVDPVSSSTPNSNVAPATPLPGMAATSFSAPPAASPPHVQGAAPGQPPPAAEAARQVARQINAFLKSSSASVEIAFDQPSKQFIVRIVDAESNQVIRQMPSEEIIAMSQSLGRMAGLLVKKEA
jgi:flagellar protein FlaG